MANQLTVFLDPTKMPNQSQAQATFDSNLAYIFATFPTFGAQFNAAITAFNAANAGSAYAIPYTVDLSSTADLDPGNGTLRFDNATQNTATTLRLDLLNNLGGNVAAILDTFDASTSAVKGIIRLVKMGDVSTYLMFNVTARTAPTGYRDITVTPITSSANNPFVQGDSVLLHFTRTGDKGDQGIPGSFPIIYVREERASGTILTGAAGAWSGRSLNTVKTNGISGASLSNSSVILPAGTYEYVGSAPGSAGYGNQARLYNATDSSVIDVGTSEYNSASNLVTRSIVRGQFTIASAKTVSLQHWINTATNGSWGIGASTGGTEVFAELLIKKVA